MPQAESTLICQRWEIMDRFGPPELNALCSLHVSLKALKEFTTSYNDNMPDGAPDVYYTPQRKDGGSYQSEEPFECCADLKTLKRVKNSSCGVWAWANPNPGSVVNLFDQEQIISMDEVLNS